MVVRNHWRKLLLALFACVWNGCESETADLYGCYSCECEGSCDPELEKPLEEMSPDTTAEYEAPIAVYGPPCYFDGSCRTEDSENK